jgi:hypothetical protein
MALSMLLPVLDASSMRCRMTKVLSMLAGASEPILRVSSGCCSFLKPRRRGGNTERRLQQPPKD